MLRPGLIGSAIGTDTVKIHTSVTIIQLQMCCETNMANCNSMQHDNDYMYVPRIFLKQCNTDVLTLLLSILSVKCILNFSSLSSTDCIIFLSVAIQQMQIAYIHVGI